MESPGAHYKKSAQVKALGALVRRLPKPGSPPLKASTARRSGTARRLTTQQLQELAHSYQRGATLYELGEQFGIDRRTVSVVLQRQGVEMRQQGLSPEQVDEAVRLYEDGLSLARVGKRVRASARTVSAKLRERGVQVRDCHGRPR